MVPRNRRDDGTPKTMSDDRPTVADLQHEGLFTELARHHWLKRNQRTTKVKVKNDLLKNEIWDVLAQNDFQYRYLLELDNLQILESYLWPGFSEDATNHHILLIALIANVRSRENLPVWGIFSEQAAEFSSFFKRILSMTLDASLSINIRTHVLAFIISAFQSLDSAIVRKECAPLVSISIWHNLSTEKKRESRLDQSAQLRKVWRASGKRYDAADVETKSRLRFERSWLYSMVLHFLKEIYDQTSRPDNVLYCERFLELLSDLQSQLPTRRYVNTLLLDMNLSPIILLSPMYNAAANELFRDLHALFKHYTYFSIDDHTGVQHSQEQTYDLHCDKLAILQRTALKHFKEKLTILALSNYGSIEKRTELEGHLSALSDAEIKELCDLLSIRTEYADCASVMAGRELYIEVLLTEYEKRKTFQETARDMTIMPTESALFEPMLLRNEAYNGSQPLALPKLNLQYLTVGDFLWRSFMLHRCEAFYEIRSDIEDTVKRLRPRPDRNGGTHFDGFSKMSLPITKPSILEVVPALVGEDVASAVRAEIALDVSRLAEPVRKEWESLRPDDVVFLVAIEAVESRISNGGSVLCEAQKLGLKYVRAAEVTQVLDEQGRPLRDHNASGRSRLRRLHVKLDAVAYQADAAQASAGKADIYDSINVIIRRRGRENNFKPVLDSIRSLTLSEVPLAPWLHEVFLGYGDPAGASYPNMAKQIKKVDYRDTFLDWQHLVESLPGKTIEPNDDTNGSFGPPYVLETSTVRLDPAPTKVSKKRRRGAEEPISQDIQEVRVSTYKPPNTGPYPGDEPKLNTVRFTPKQIEAIISGTQPGLTVIVGPPGTGKTDVATQIINNIYHNFPEQRTLLIAHSNQALNQLFQKIVALDIDQRHLLRLGHGESELETDSDFSKYGRVDSFLENRNVYLREVDRLAANLNAPGAHGSSAETAGYFNQVYVEPAWTRFQETIKADEVSNEEILEAFPFHEYFSNAPMPVFPPDANKDTILDIANGCYYHISKIFAELADVRPFEILPRERDKANYLLTNEARIIAMTSTHAAMRRGQIADLGFHYDNVIMEEAAQITEIENFIPLALQRPKEGSKALKRVVLCGDHLQNSPVVQNMAFRQYANLEQSLFSRLVRLGVPTIDLDQQGRARPSIAELYQWRYNSLGNLPIVETASEYLTANAGFRYDYQFINVPDYKDRGESEPTPHFIQNLGEAEYAVAIYQYMRLLGYPASKISILATYAGQRALIRDVLNHRCAQNPLFGMPRIVTTVDKYQGEQNDYVILSLTRTTRVGYLRDVRRLTVALSRARLGLYILGRRELFETCFELQPAFDILLRRSDKLTLVTGELYPSKRLTKDEEPKIKGRKSKEPVEVVVDGQTVMEGVEHLGQYVFQMTESKIKQIRAERGLPEEVELSTVAVVPEEEGLVAVDEGEDDDEEAYEAADYYDQ